MLTQTATCRCLILMQKICLSLSGRCSRVMRWHLIFAFCMVHAAIRAQAVAGLFRSALLVMTPAMLIVPDERHPFPGRDMIAGQRLREDWFPVVFRR